MCLTAGTRAILMAVLSGLSFITASCGDFQDPASGQSNRTMANSGPQGADSTSPSSPQAPMPGANGGENQMAALPPTHAGDVGQSIAPTETTSSPADALGSLLAPSGNSPMTKSVTLGWDPSQSALGYKVYLIATSSSAQQIFDTGPLTQLEVTLPLGESYYFTVAGYNAAGEGPPAPYLRFDLF